MPFRHALIALILLPFALPNAQAMGRSARHALAAIDEGARASASDSVLVMRGDQVLLERYSAGGERKLETMSATKSVVSLGIGALLTDGKIQSLDMPVHTWFPEWKQGRKQRITLRMLLEHNSGLQNEARPAIEIYPAPDVVQLALAAELSDDPGKRFAYNNKAVNLLSGIIARASGQPMDTYIGDRLLKPLGITPADWYKDDAGNPHAMAGLFLTAHDMARIGRLVLQHGMWNGQRLIDASYLETMLAPSSTSPEVGLLWWRRPAYVSFHADAASFEQLTKAGVEADLVDKLRILDGRSFADEAQLYAGLSEALGDRWGEIWYPRITTRFGIGPWRPFHPAKGPVEAFEANGSLGQYIVIVPKADLVAVRQIESREDLGEASGYDDFTARVQALADALVASR